MGVGGQRHALHYCIGGWVGPRDSLKGCWQSVMWGGCEIQNCESHCTSCSCRKLVFRANPQGFARFHRNTCVRACVRACTSAYAALATLKGKKIKPNFP